MKIMIIGAGQFQVPAIVKAKEMGLYVIATDRFPKAEGFKFADVCEIVDVKDIKDNIKVARKHSVDGVLSVVSELGVRTSSAVAEDMGLVGLKREVAFALTNKAIMRAIFQKNQLPSPDFIRVKTKEGAIGAIKFLKLPVVMKPTDSSGSRGVTKIDNIKDIDFSFKWAKENSLSGDIIIETFLDGSEMTVEAISYNGEHEILAMSNKKRLPFPYCVSIDLTYPPINNRVLLHDVKTLMKKALNALRVESGATHSEVMITPDGPVLIEIAGRGGGFGTFSDIIPLVSGVDAVEQCINIAMGFKVDIKPKYEKSAVLRFFNPPLGEIVSISGLSYARKLHGVRKVEIGAKVGDVLKPITRDGLRPGLMITYGENRSDAVRTADMVEKMIKFEVK